MSVTTHSERPAEAPPTVGARFRAVLVALGLTLLSLVAGVVAGVPVFVALALAGYDVTSVEALARPEVLVASALATQGAMVLVGYAYARRYGLPVPIRRLSRRDGVTVGVSVVAALALATVGGAVVSLLVPVDQQATSVFGDLSAVDPSVLLVLAVLSVLWIAPAEEYLFRGVVQGRLRASFGVAATLAVAGGLFASIHLFNYSGTATAVLAYLGLLAVVSLVFGYAYERTGNLTVPVAIHALYNAVLLGVSYVALVVV